MLIGIEVIRFISINIYGKMPDHCVLIVTVLLCITMLRYYLYMFFVIPCIDLFNCRVSVDLSLRPYVADAFIRVSVCIYGFSLWMGMTSCVSLCLFIYLRTVFFFLEVWCNLLYLYVFEFFTLFPVVPSILCCLFLS